MTPTSSNRVASPAHPAASILLVLEATQEEVGTLRTRLSGSLAAKSLDSPASGRPLGSLPLGLHDASKSMTPLAFRNPMLDVPPLDMIGFFATPQPSSGSKAFIVRRMLSSDLHDWGSKGLSSEDAAQASFERHLDTLEKDLAEQQGLMRQRTQERARLISKRDSLSEEVVSLSRELKIVKAEIEELQARVASLSSRRDFS
ncbi:hypothetical protein AMTR_s00082p00133500 [Amborella trichopoda]|uniref:Uncharacterized protein n=1 Tax=Amborella trichopoda TaxID=13333 RepID=W1NVR3_AMBTC|nr:hypothetical protein AMTR_s00082p00133500 [Amborella trichopoda]